jgi:hypothetical protein
MGPWAVWAIAQWVLDPKVLMLTRQTFYPSPAARLRMIASFAKALQIAGAEELRTDIIDSAGFSKMDEKSLDFRISEEVAKIVTSGLPDGQGNLTERVGFRKADFDPKKAVDNWSKALLGKIDREDDNELRTARLVTAAAVKASYKIVHVADEEDRTKYLSALRQNAPKRIAACFAKGVRAAPMLLEHRREPSLARIVLDASEEMLLR